MDSASTIRRARSRAALTQAELATRMGTSQPTVSAYESGQKVPELETLARLLDACGLALVVSPARRPRADLEVSGRRLEDVISLAEALPFRRDGALRYPRLPA